MKRIAKFISLPLSFLIILSQLATPKAFAGDPTGLPVEQGQQVLTKKPADVVAKDEKSSGVKIKIPSGALFSAEETALQKIEAPADPLAKLKDKNKIGTSGEINTAHINSLIAAGELTYEAARNMLKAEIDATVAFVTANGPSILVTTAHPNVNMDRNKSGSVTNMDALLLLNVYNQLQPPPPPKAMTVYEPTVTYSPGVYNWSPTITTLSSFNYQLPTGENLQTGDKVTSTIKLYARGDRTTVVRELTSPSTEGFVFEGLENGKQFDYVISVSITRNNVVKYAGTKEGQLNSMGLSDVHYERGANGGGAIVATIAGFRDGYIAPTIGNGTGSTIYPYTKITMEYAGKRDGIADYYRIVGDKIYLYPSVIPVDGVYDVRISFQSLIDPFSQPDGYGGYNYAAPYYKNITASRVTFPVTPEDNVAMLTSLNVINTSSTSVEIDLDILNINEFQEPVIIFNPAGGFAPSITPEYFYLPTNNGNGKYSLKLTGLTPGKSYSYQIGVRMKHPTIKDRFVTWLSWAGKTFTVQPPVPPVISGAYTTRVLLDSAKIVTEITGFNYDPDRGRKVVIEYYETGTSNKLTKDMTLVAGTTGKFEYTITGLSPEKNYTYVIKTLDNLISTSEKAYSFTTAMRPDYSNFNIVSSVERPYPTNYLRDVVVTFNVGNLATFKGLTAADQLTVNLIYINMRGERVNMQLASSANGVYTFNATGILTGETTFIAEVLLNGVKLSDTNMKPPAKPFTVPAQTVLHPAYKSALVTTTTSGQRTVEIELANNIPSWATNVEVRYEDSRYMNGMFGTPPILTLQRVGTSNVFRGVIASASLRPDVFALTIKIFVNAPNTVGKIQYGGVMTVNLKSPIRQYMDATLNPSISGFTATPGINGKVNLSVTISNPPANTKITFRVKYIENGWEKYTTVTLTPSSTNPNVFTGSYTAPRTSDGGVGWMDRVYNLQLLFASTVPGTSSTAFYTGLYAPFTPRGALPIV